MPRARDRHSRSRAEKGWEIGPITVFLWSFLRKRRSCREGLFVFSANGKVLLVPERRFMEKKSTPKRSTMVSLSTSQNSSSQISQAAGRLQSEHLCTLIRGSLVGVKGKSLRSGRVQAPVSYLPQRSDRGRLVQAATPCIAFWRSVTTAFKTSKDGILSIDWTL